MCLFSALAVALRVRDVAGIFVTEKKGIKQKDLQDETNTLAYTHIHTHTHTFTYTNTTQKNTERNTETLEIERDYTYP